LNPSAHKEHVLDELQVWQLATEQLAVKH